MSKREWYKWAWIAWVVSFAVLEWRAIVDDDKEAGDFTLSHYIRRLATKSWLFRGFIAGILIWLGPMDHFNLF